MRNIVPQAKLSVRRHRGSLLLLTLVACAAALLLGVVDRNVDLRQEERRVLQVSALNLPAPGGNATVVTTVTIHIADRSKRAKDENPAHSIFYTDVLRRYGSGRVGHRVVEHRSGDRRCMDEPFAAHEGPCLAVTKGRRKSHDDALRCNFPGCKTIVTNDEICKAYVGFDAREYFSYRMKDAGYLPLGPRRDAWTSLEKIQGDTPDFALKPASARRYAFNAIFSASTNKGRGKLAEIIASVDAADEPDALPTFTTIAKEWTKYVNDKSSKQLDTDHYMAVVLDSVFTLAPAGHNAECFRMFEAAEAGSIPVFLKKDLYKNVGVRCSRGLQHWYEAPVLVLDKWTDLYPVVKALMDDPAALNERQERLRVWYEGYMRGVVAEFEDFLLSPPRERAPKAPVKDTREMKLLGQKKKKEAVKRRKRRKMKKKVAQTSKKEVA